MRLPAQLVVDLGQSRINKMSTITSSSQFLSGHQHLAILLFNFGDIKMSVGDDNNKYVFDDGKRLDMPYIAGACFDIKRHKRLPPFDNGKTYKFPELSSLSEPLLPSDILSLAEILKPIDNMMPWRQSPSKPSQVPLKTITKRYLRHRPRKTESHDEDKTIRRLEIIRPIRVYDGVYA